MNYVGATRKQLGSQYNNDAFAVCGSFAFLLDGAGNCQGRTSRLTNIIKAQMPQMPEFPRLVTLLNFSATSLGIEATFLGVHIRDMFLTGMSVGDSRVYLLREGTLTRLNESTRRRLGQANPEAHHFCAVLKKHDCLILASDGLVLERYRLVQTLQRHLLRPTEIPEAVLAAQKDFSDDATVVCRILGGL